MLIDSHCHLDRLDLSKYAGGLADVVAAAGQQGVKHLLCVGIDLSHYQRLLQIVDQFTGKQPSVSASVGLHPSEPNDPAFSLEQLVALGSDQRIVAIGETGLDYLRTEYVDEASQRQRFRLHIQAAKLLNKPLIIHTRRAQADTIRLMQEEGAAEVGGVMHCFTEDLAMAEQAIALGFYISFSGIITFKNAEALRATAKALPLARILVETDSPYLAPVPHRGKPNEPALVRRVAEFLAELRGIPLADLAAATSENFFNVFPLARPFIEDVEWR